MCAIFWCVWQERIFHNKGHHSLAILSKINHFVDFWLGHLSAKAQATLLYGRRGTRNTTRDSNEERKVQLLTLGAHRVGML